MDHKILVSGADIDGISRGKYLNPSKFKSISSSGFGFCNVVFGWGLHDEVYSPKPPIMKQGGFSDILAKVDESTKRTCPISGTLHYLVDFYDPTTNMPLPSCPRSLLKSVLNSEKRFKSLSGLEFEFYNFKETPNSLVTKDHTGLDPLTPGMFGYSLLRMAKNQDYIDEIYDKCLAYRIPLEAFHTETGPGVYEAILEYCDALELADRAHLFKLLVKKIGLKYEIMPTFMAKPYTDKPGCSGHIHLSLTNPDGSNAFYDSNDPQSISTVCRQFVAGVMEGLSSIMAILAPTVNSYKRLNIAFWAPVTVSYGFESRTAAIRIITPPTASSKSTRIEIRVPGADINTYLVLAAINACGFYGINHNLQLGKEVDPMTCELLPRTLREAVDVMKGDSLARKVLGNSFIDHYVATREHELRLWDLTVTDYELKRYMETV